MMKKLKHALVLLALLSGSVSMSAQTIRPLEENRFEIAVGENTMTVDAAHGGKILSFKHGGQEVIAQNAAAAPAPPAADNEGPAPFRRRWFNPNSYGSTFWTSPQAEWNWPPVPEYDSKPYSADLHDGTLILTGSASERFGYRIRKTFTPDPEDGAIVVSYTIINEGDEEKKAAPWEITRVPNGGFVLFKADPKAVTPADLMQVSAFQSVARIDIDVADANRKINSDGKGWLAFCDNGLVLVKRFKDLKPSEPAPGEAEIQVYIDARKSFVELESQGPYTTLKPGGFLHWTVRWYLVPQGEDVMGAIKPLVK